MSGVSTFFIYFIYLRITIFNFMQTYIETSRLILRDWKEEDIPLFFFFFVWFCFFFFFWQPFLPS